MEFVDRPTRRQKNGCRWRYGSGLVRLAVPFLILAYWHYAATMRLLPQEMLPDISEVVQSISELIANGKLQYHIVVSLKRSFSGWMLGMAFGISLGLLNGFSALGERFFDSTVQMMRTIPFLTLIPLFIVWFGIGELPKVLLIAFACFFPNYINTFAAVRNVDRKLVEAGRIFRLTQWQIVFRVVLPTALPTILVGVRYSMAVSVLALVGAEQINASSGLGLLMADARNNLRTDVVLGCILVYATLGIIIDLFMRALTRFLLPWHDSVAQ